MDGREPDTARRTDETRGVTRRSVLALCATAGVGALAGCGATDDAGTVTTATPDGAAAGTTAAGTTETTGTASTGSTSESAASAGSTFERLYESIHESVTTIETTAGTGSGWVFDAAGRVVTNEHVVESASTVDVRYSRDEWRSARVVGTDPIGDLAVVEPESSPEYAAPLSLADADPDVGSDVAIIGAPFGLPDSLSVGVVSATNRLLETAAGSSIPGAIQVDATANPGNSGGPILSTAGDVIGVLNSGEGVAVNFGIPARLVEDVVPTLIESGTYEYSTLGTTLTEVDPAVARVNDLDEVTGVLVTSVTAGGPADGELEASSRQRGPGGSGTPVGGDVIIGLADRTITSLDDYASYLAFSTRPDDSLDVTILRDGERRTVQLTVGSRSRV